jgi:hypothetical protein
MEVLITKKWKEFLEHDARAIQEAFQTQEWLEEGL